MIRSLGMILLLTASVPAQDVSPDLPPSAGKMIVVIGAGGTEEYEQIFRGWAEKWKAAAKVSKIEYNEIGRSEGKENDAEKLKALIDDSLSPTDSPLWLVLIGHGTYDRNIGKFNLRGPDVSATELQEWLQECRRPLIAVNGFSCSGAFLKPLSAENRVVITATSTGAELNYSRFGGYLAESLTDIAADLDHDDQISLLEAYLLASSRVARFYESESRLSTEHALLDDNHDAKGTSADFFEGIRAQGKAKTGESPDGRLAHRYILVHSNTVPNLTAEQIAERDRLETEIEKLRDEKRSIEEDVYYDRLEQLLLQLAKLYEST